MSMLSDDTDRTVAIKLEHLSPTWVKEIDEKAGRALAENGMHFRLEAQFEGHPRPRWYDLILRYIPWKRRTVA